MKLLVSPQNFEEAQAALAGGADIIDVKNPAEGSLGANFPWVIRGIVQAVHGYPGVETSATLGDAPYLPGTMSLAALGAARLGLNYVKVGLFGPTTELQVEKMLGSIVKTVKHESQEIKVVAAGYADFSRLTSSLDPLLIPPIAARVGCDVVMVDTRIKDGTSLLDHLSWEKTRQFVDLAKSGGLEVALAGSLSLQDCNSLKALGPDIIGVRSAVCRGFNRENGIVPDLVEDLKLKISL